MTVAQVSRSFRNASIDGGEVTLWVMNGALGQGGRGGFAPDCDQAGAGAVRCSGRKWPQALQARLALHWIISPASRTATVELSARIILAFFKLDPPPRKGIKYPGDNAGAGATNGRADDAMRCRPAGCDLIIPSLAPVVLQGIAALGLRRIPARRAHPKNLIGAPGLGGVVVPRPARAGILEFDHGEIGPRRGRKRETRRQNAHRKYQSLHYQLPLFSLVGILTSTPTNPNPLLQYYQSARPTAAKCWGATQLG